MVKSKKIQEDYHQEVVDILESWIEGYKEKTLDVDFREEREWLMMVVRGKLGPFEGETEEGGHLFYLLLYPHSSGTRSTIKIEHITRKCRICNPSYYE